VISLAALMGDDESEDAGQNQGGSLWEILSAQGYPRPSSAAEMGDLLDRAGNERFAGKSREFQTFLAEQDPDQTLYEGLMEGLGYRQNQHAFLLLAQLAGYSALRRAAIRLPVGEQASAIEAWLVALSGLDLEGGSGDSQLAGTGFGPAMPRQAWHCFRVRPANHPLRRIFGAAGLVSRFLETGLVEGLYDAAATGKPALLTSALAVPSSSGSGPATVGVGRARDLSVNVVLPFLHALAEIRQDAQEAESHLETYGRFGKLQDNELTREMSEQLMAPGWQQLVNNARRQQGLLHLKNLISGMV
jgi:hypothetical protein